MAVIIAFIGGGILVALLTWLANSWRRYQGLRRREAAKTILKQHGLSPQLYIGTFGIQDEKLRNALDEFTFTGHIILNENDEVVGGVLPKLVKKPRLRLISGNKH